MQLDSYPPALSAPQVAEILGVSRAHVWRLVKSGELPSFRLGRLHRVPRAAIEDLLARGAVSDSSRQLGQPVAEPTPVVSGGRPSRD